MSDFVVTVVQFDHILMADGIATVVDGKATLFMTDVVVILEWK